MGVYLFILQAREAAFQEAAKKCEARVSSLRAALSAEVSRRRSLASSLREMVETAFYQMQAVVQVPFLPPWKQPLYLILVFPINVHHSAADNGSECRAAHFGDGS
jgi:hypothetical protein